MFEANVQAVVDLIMEKDKNLSQETARHWDEVLCRAFFFDRDAKEAAITSTLTPADLLEFYDRYFAPRGEGRRKMATWVHGNQFPINGAEGAAGDGENEREGREGRGVVMIHDYNEFKRSMPLLPLRKPPVLGEVSGGQPSNSKL